MDDKYIYIVAGDEMKKIMEINFPNRKIIPFREDFSKGKITSEVLDNNLISERTKFWGVLETEYIKKISPILNLDLDENYILCFGEDDCCKANLTFMINYLKRKKYSKQIKVQIVDEYTLEIKKEYLVEI